MRGSKSFLEKTFDVPVRYFAYPFGRVSSEAVEAVKESGYELALTTRKAGLSSRYDPFQLPRVNWGRKSTLFGLYKYFFLPAG